MPTQYIIDYFKIFGRGEITSIDPIINWVPEKPELVVAKVEYHLAILVFIRLFGMLLGPGWLA